MLEIKILPAKGEHLESLLEIEAVCFSDGWSRDTLTYILEDERSVYLVAVVEGGIVGYGGIWWVLDEANLDNIAVLPNFQKKGVAKRLLLSLIEECKKLAIKTLMLEVRESNRNAIALYEKFGFYSVGVRREYYTKPDENAVLMNLDMVY